ncbi:MAG: hypothetical protein M0T85_01850 [Dehalococcoidales bacterium]|nr:hypothetical protein [Dehalococcoidales bacterium]
MQATLAPTETIDWLDDLIAKWDPEQRPVHCSNCRHCIARPPLARCELGHGPEHISLLSLLRAKYPKSFRAAASCEDFDSLSDKAYAG